MCYPPTPDSNWSIVEDTSGERFFMVSVSYVEDIRSTLEIKMVIYESMQKVLKNSPLETRWNFPESDYGMICKQLVWLEPGILKS